MPSSEAGVIDQIWIPPGEQAGHLSPIAGLVSMCGKVETARYWVKSKSASPDQYGGDQEADLLLSIQGRDTSQDPILDRRRSR